MLVALINAVKVESVPLNFNFFRSDSCALRSWQLPEITISQSDSAPDCRLANG